MSQKKQVGPDCLLCKMRGVSGGSQGREHTGAWSFSALQPRKTSGSNSVYCVQTALFQSGPHQTEFLPSRKASFQRNPKMSP